MNAQIYFGLVEFKIKKFISEHVNEDNKLVRFSKHAFIGLQMEHCYVTLLPIPITVMQVNFCCYDNQIKGKKIFGLLHIFIVP
jgi:hypothetical protein